MITIQDLLPVAVDLELKHPVTGQPLGVSVKVVGPDSAEIRLARAAFMKKMAEREGKLEINEQIAENDAFTAALITGWSSDEFFQGPFSKEAALALIQNPGYAWLKEQVSEFTDKRANFFRASGIAS